MSSTCFGLLHRRPFSAATSPATARYVTDPVSNLGFQFLGTFEPACFDACDFDDNGFLEIADPIGNLTHQFLGGPPPAAPGKNACGVDPTKDWLNCESVAACAAGG